MKPFFAALLAGACAAAPAWPAPVKDNSVLPPEIREFLGPAPKGFDKKYMQPARRLRKAVTLRQAGKSAGAITELAALTQGELAEHALFNLALAYRENRDFAKSTAQANRLWLEFPGSIYLDRVPNLIRSNDCDLGRTEAAKAKGPAARAKAAADLERCLAKTPWKEWDERQAELTELYEIRSRAKDEVYAWLVTDIVQALPPTAMLRLRVAKEIPAERLNELASVARFRSKNPNPAGVKATYPDAELFDQAIRAVLKENWGDANELFKKFVAEFPQSERLDGAQYWVARTEEQQGNAEAAKQKYEQIFNESPFSYYGLQSGLRLKKDLQQLIAPAAGPPHISSPEMRGSVFSAQGRSLLRLRALVEAGLVDEAREEAKFLFQYRPLGFTLGQEAPEGALLMAELYSVAGYPLASFAHAYSAFSFDRTLVRADTLRFLFPQHFAASFAAASERTGIHPLLLYSVAKQESAFIPNAISRAEALGLLQLLQSTAAEMRADVKREELFDTDVNTELGARYLLKLLDRFQGNTALALAGYNAGPTRASSWLRQFSELSTSKEGFNVDAFIEFIPFTETRKYVSSILRNFTWYKLLDNDGTIGLAEELIHQWPKPTKIPAPPNPPPPASN